MTLSQAEREEHNRLDLRRLNEYTRSGNIDILGELYRQYMTLVYGVCLKYLGEREEARDAVMSIFEKLVTEVTRHEISNFRAWLYVLTKNFCLMALRSRATAKEQLRLSEAESNSFMEKGFDLHPFDEETGINDAALEDCIEKLKSEQRDCIRLFFYSQKSYREISAELEMDEKKVKSHLQNAKRNLKICLEEADEKE